MVLFAPDKSGEFELGEPKILALDTQGWALFPKNNAHFVHRDAEMVFWRWGLQPLHPRLNSRK